MKAKNPVIRAVQKEAMAVSADMRELHSNFKTRKIERADADTTANIAGKNLKALAIVIAGETFLDGHLSLVHRIEQTK